MDVCINFFSILTFLFDREICKHNFFLYKYNNSHCVQETLYQQNKHDPIEMNFMIIHKATRYNITANKKLSIPKAIEKQAFLVVELVEAA